MCVFAILILLYLYHLDSPLPAEPARLSCPSEQSIERPRERCDREEVLVLFYPLTMYAFLVGADRFTLSQRYKSLLPANTSNAQLLGNIAQLHEDVVRILQLCPASFPASAPTSIFFPPLITHPPDRQTSPPPTPLRQVAVLPRCVPKVVRCGAYGAFF